ncbi:MAG: serine--tRNA ligase [Gammaproteobacteria bacterium]
MIDPALLRNDFDAVAANLLRRGINLQEAGYQKAADRRHKTQTARDTLRAKRNDISKQIGIAKAKGDNAAAADMAKNAATLGDEVQKAEGDFNKAHDAEMNILRELPNLLQESVPDGKDEKDNREERRYGDIPAFDFAAQDHTAIGAGLAMADFEQAAKIASARFVILGGALAKMHRALAQWMMDLHTGEHNYREMYLPMLANPNALYGTGQLPKFADDLFYAERDKLYMIPTAEVSATNLARERIINESDLPMRIVAHTPCFRREAGAYGKDTRGMLRQHQFDKVELVHLTSPDDSNRSHGEMTAHAEKVLRLLQLPYRVITLCAGDTGFAASKTYDLEVWLPGQNAYREISSCSNCLDFQARRMMARCRGRDGKIRYMHTLNGSGVAVGRALIAVMENYQQADGGIVVPEVLRPYMRNMPVIRKA